MNNSNLSLTNNNNSNKTSFTGSSACLIKRDNSHVKSFGLTVAKAGITTGAVVGGYMAGSYIANAIENPILANVAKFGVTAVGAVAANLVCNQIDKKFNYTVSTVGDVVTKQQSEIQTNMANALVEQFQQQQEPMQQFQNGQVAPMQFIQPQYHPTQPVQQQLIQHPQPQYAQPMQHPQPQQPQQVQQTVVQTTPVKVQSASDFKQRELDALPQTIQLPNGNYAVLQDQVIDNDNEQVFSPGMVNGRSILPTRFPELLYALPNGEQVTVQKQYVEIYNPTLQLQVDRQFVQLPTLEFVAVQPHSDHQKSVQEYIKRFQNSQPKPIELEPDVTEQTPGSQSKNKKGE